MFPFMINSPTWNFPLSGSVNQDIAPSLFSGIKGVPEVEAEVVTTVASYGAQLSMLTDAMIALADAQGFDGPEVDKLRQLQTDVAAAKERVKDAVRARAAAAQADVERLEKGV